MPVQTKSVFRFAGLEVHEQELRAMRGGQPLEIEPKAFRVLVYLIKHAGHLVSKSELMDAVWGETAVTENSLTRAIALLRRVLEDDPRQPRFIETVSTAGYRFVCPVATEEPPEVEQKATQTEKVVSISDSAEVELSVSPPDSEEKTRVSFLRRWRWVLVASAAAVASAAGIFLWYIHQPLPPPHIGQIRKLTQDVRWRWKGALGVDGARVFFRGRPSGLFAVGNSGEIETIPLDLPWPSGREIWASDVSPDGSYFLTGPPNGPPALWVFTTTGKPVRLIAGDRVRGAVWSPDSKQVVCWMGDGKAYSFPIPAGEPRYLFTSEAGVAGGWYSWSPDGKRIRFSKDNGIWEIASDGSNLHEFLPGMKGSVSKCCGSWTPDGAFYIFASERKKNIYPHPGAAQLWALDERSGTFRKPSPDPVQLTFEPMNWTFPVISQDSRTIFATGTVRQGELVRFDAKTGQAVRYLGGISADFLTFSPDGKYVAYVSYPERKVWRANRDGSGRILLAEPEEGAWGLHWSPDGTRILFATGSETYLVSSQGGKPDRVQFPPADKSGEFDPTWSPDGKRLVYTVDSYPNVTPNGIRILDLETHRSTALPTAPAPVHGPRWSPDGRYIFCEAEPDVGGAVFDTEKQKWMYFPSKVTWNWTTWAHDSRSVYFLLSSPPLTFQGVYRISIPSGRIERVVDLTSFRLAGNVFGYWLGLDPEDHPLLLRDSGSIELYALTLER